MKVGLKKRINSIMTIAFYKLSGVIQFEEAEKMLKADVKKLYGDKGDEVVKMNMDALEHAIENLVEVKYNKEKWAAFDDTPIQSIKTGIQFIDEVH